MRAVLKPKSFMNIALFAKRVQKNNVPFVQELIAAIRPHCRQWWMYKPFYEATLGSVIFPDQPLLFENQQDIEGKVDYLFSIGGDGTILDAVGVVGNSGVPVIGINLGRLGFLSGISREEVAEALEALDGGRFSKEERTLLQLVSPDGLFGKINYALNDLTVYKPNAMSLLTIKTWVNGAFLNAYWADGLIVATPTGSTAYSLSCTGPIITPDAENILITPIASHNLTVRPIVIRDDSEIRICIGGKASTFLVSLDSRTTEVNRDIELYIAKASFKINLIRLERGNFFSTIREKLNWGLDNRNYQENN